MSTTDSESSINDIRVADLSIDGVEFTSEDDKLATATLVIIGIICYIEDYSTENNVAGFIEKIKNAGVFNTLCSLYDLLESTNCDVEIKFDPSVLITEHKACSAILKQSYKDFLEKAIMEY